MSSDTTSASASLVVTQVGQPLSVSVATDKSAYLIGDKITITISVNRAFKGTLTITPPSATPLVFDYQNAALYGQSYAVVKTLTASQPIGRWTVTFQADDYCSGFGSSVAYYDVTPDTYSVSISLSGIVPSLSVNLQVDGQNQGTMGGSDIKSLSFKVGTSHTIAVDQYVSGDVGVRYFASQNTWSVGSTGSHTFSYLTQYYFTVGSDPDGVAQLGGNGWFNAGSTIQTGVAPKSINATAGTQYALKGWMVDGGPLQAGNQISLTLDKPHKAVAQYTTQYQLLIDSPSGTGTPQGSGYYDAGSTAQFSVTSPVGLLVQQVFVRWEGDFSGTSPRGTIVMDKPHVVHATWTTSYTPLYLVGSALAIAIVAALFLLRRRKANAPVTKPTPPPTEAETSSSESDPSDNAKSVKCTSCGETVPAGISYCTKCGTKLDPL